jgi:hypothetical protein
MVAVLILVHDLQIRIIHAAAAQLLQTSSGNTLSEVARAFAMALWSKSSDYIWQFSPTVTDPHEVR